MSGDAQGPQGGADDDIQNKFEEFSYQLENGYKTIIHLDGLTARDSIDLLQRIIVRLTQCVSQQL